MIWPWVLSGIGLAVAAAPVVAEAVRMPVTARHRADAPGKIAELPGGATHYRWTGSDGDPVAVCIHGLSTPSYVFAATERSLARLGFRVLCYDLYGRGYSERVGGAQNVDFFLRQLRELLRDQAVTGPLTVLGFSMGGQIAAAFAAEEASRVEALVLVAPAGILPAGAASAGAWWRAPLTGGWLTRVLGGFALRRELIENRSTPTVIPDFEDRQAAETKTRGYLPALLSSRRHLLSQSSHADHARIRDNGTRVLAIWGSEDPVIPLSAMGRLAALNPRVRHEQIAGAGHNLLQTHPAQVAEALRAFLAP